MEVGTYVIINKRPDPFEITYFLPYHIFSNEPLLFVKRKRFFLFRKEPTMHTVQQAKKILGSCVTTE